MCRGLRNTLKIAEQYLPHIVELCRLVKQTLFEVGRASASMLVEYLIMDKCMETNRLIANRPDDAAIQQRLMHPIKGGYVKEPEPGLHENIAVWTLVRFIRQLSSATMSALTV